MSNRSAVSSARLPLGVTTSGSPSDSDLRRALALAARLGVPLVPRAHKEPLRPMLASVAQALLVEGGAGLVLWDAAGSLRFSPGMAALRVKRLEAGERDDLLVRLGELREGDHVLDGTLGLSQDALVAARAVGPQGRVLGVEASLALYGLVSDGLARLGPLPSSCPIEPRRGEAGAVLRDLSDASFDVVMLDPMFARPKASSHAFEALRRHADHRPLAPEVLEEARRVARRWVLVKAARYSPELRRLGLRAEPRSASAPVVWARVLGRGQ